MPPPEGGRCIDVGCGFGDTTRRLAELTGPEGFALGTDSSSRFIDDARDEAAAAGAKHVAFEVSDAQTASWDPSFDYAFSRVGTQFFAAPVPAMRAIRGALVPGGRLNKVCWRRKQDSAIWAETEEVVHGEHGERRRPEIAEAVADRFASWRHADGSIVGRASVWFVTATNPGSAGINLD